MKKILLALCFALASALSYAYDFAVDGIYYNILSIEDKTAEVTYNSSLNYQQTKVVIPSSVSWNGYRFTVKGIHAFTFCKSNYPNKVDSVIISEGVEYIKQCAFQSANLKMIQIPKSLSVIESNAFGGNYKSHITDWHVVDYDWLCSSGLFSPYTVKDIYVNNVKLEENLVIPEGVSCISGGTFNGLGWIKTVEIPGSVEYIDGSAFGNCSNLESVFIHEGVKEIYGNRNKKGNTWYGTGTFSNCQKFKTITIPSTVTYIGTGAFTDSPSLQVVESYISAPFDLEDGVFSNGQYLSTILRVPRHTSSKYYKYSGWKNFVNIEERDAINFTINIQTTDGGSVFHSGNNVTGEISVYEDDNFTLVFKPDDGYELKSVVVNGINVIEDVENNSYTISSVSQNASIVVTFAELPIYLTIKSADNGSIAQEIEKGKSYSYVITPNDGWNIESVSFNGSNVTSLLINNKYTTPPITSDSELNVVYKQEESNDDKVTKRESKIKVSASYGKLTVENSGLSTNLYVYTTSGTEVTSEAIGYGTTSFNLPTNNIYIIKIGNETFKVSM